MVFLFMTEWYSTVCIYTIFCLSVHLLKDMGFSPFGLLWKMLLWTFATRLCMDKCLNLSWYVARSSVWLISALKFIISLLLLALCLHSASFSSFWRWDESFLIWERLSYSAIHFPLWSALFASHKFWYVEFLFSFSSVF